VPRWPRSRKRPGAPGPNDSSFPSLQGETSRPGENFPILTPAGHLGRGQFRPDTDRRRAVGGKSQQRGDRAPDRITMKRILCYHEKGCADSRRRA
jgi:hypothetical protein